MRSGDSNAVDSIFSNLMRDSGVNMNFKLDLVQMYVKWKESREDIKGCFKIFENALEIFNYDKILVSLYASYLRRHEEYHVAIEKVIKVYESCMNRARGTINYTELSNIAKLYKCFLRSNCNELDFVRKVEGLITRRVEEVNGELNEVAWAKSEGFLEEEIKKWRKKFVIENKMEVINQNGWEYNNDDRNAEQAVHPQVNGNDDSGNGEVEDLVGLRKRSYPGPGDS